MTLVRAALLSLVGLAAFAAPLAAEERPWPPVGPKWETDPEAAFAKARETGKGVFVYVATES
jgi:hypothetical protein